MYNELISNFIHFLDPESDIYLSLSKRSSASW